jgi:hypothetical protein
MEDRLPDIFVKDPKDDPDPTSTILDFLRGEIPKIAHIQGSCPHCKGPLQLPIVVHPEHLRAMVLIISTVMDFAAKEEILPEEIWKDLRDQINHHLTIH